MDDQTAEAIDNEQLRLLREYLSRTPSQRAERRRELLARPVTNHWVQEVQRDRRTA